MGHLIDLHGARLRRAALRAQGCDRAGALDDLRVAHSMLRRAGLRNPRLEQLMEQLESQLRPEPRPAALDGPAAPFACEVLRLPDRRDALRDRSQLA